MKHLAEIALYSCAAISAGPLVEDILDELFEARAVGIGEMGHRMLLRLDQALRANVKDDRESKAFVGQTLQDLYNQFQIELAFAKRLLGRREDVVPETQDLRFISLLDRSREERLASELISSLWRDTIEDLSVDRNLFGRCFGEQSLWPKDRQEWIRNQIIGLAPLLDGIESYRRLLCYRSLVIPMVRELLKNAILYRRSDTLVNVGMAAQAKYVVASFQNEIREDEFGNNHWSNLQIAASRLRRHATLSGQGLGIREAYKFTILVNYPPLTMDLMPARTPDEFRRVRFALPVAHWQ